MDSDSSFSHHTTDSASQMELRRRLQKTWKEIEDVKERIQATLDEIAKANASLIKLRMVEKELLEAAAATASSASPTKFQHVPVDIMGEIAGYFNVPNSVLRVIASENTDGLWPLTYVCRSWRAGILSLPWLWSSFRINPFRGSRLQLVSTVLERSANHPLTIQLLPHFTSPTNSVISLLVKHSRRWKNIRLHDIRGPTPLLPLRGRLPQLEKLELGFDSHNAEPWCNSNEEQSIFEDAPKLIELRISKIPCTDGGDCVSLRFPLHQMQSMHHYRGGYYDKPYFLDKLANFANVSDLQLGVSYSIPLRINTITLPRVTSLTLGLVEILRSLWLPSLTSLHFDYDHGDDVDTVTAFLTEHIESFANWGLATLSVFGGGPVMSFIDILSHAALDNLHTLSAHFREADWDGMSDIMALLIWNSPRRARHLSTIVTSEWLSTNVMPHLQRLTLNLSYYYLEEGMFDAVREMVISRMYANKVAEAGPECADALDQVDDPSLDSVPARLQYFYISYRSNVFRITMEDLNSLMERKFAVTLISCDRDDTSVSSSED